VVRFESSSDPPCERYSTWWSCRFPYEVQPGNVQRQPSRSKTRCSRWSSAFASPQVSNACSRIASSASLSLAVRPLRRSIYTSLAARTELIWSRRDDVTETQRAFGFYGSLDYQFKRRWFVGARYDQSERARDAAVLDRGQSAVLTYWPSEFSQVRGQYRRLRFGDDGQVANELLFQVLFTIGAHGAHPF